MKKIVVFQTTDGQQFQAIEKAEKHVIDKTAMDLRAMLIGAANGAGCRGFVANYANSFTDYFLQNMHQLESIINFKNENSADFEE